MEVTKSVEFSFPVTNNVAEYEALISGLELARRVDIHTLKEYSDSNLLVQQMNGEYEVRDLTLKKYVEMAKNRGYARLVLTSPRVRDYPTEST